MTTSGNPPKLFDRDYYQDPYPAFSWLRDNAPVHEFTFPAGAVTMWIITRFDDVHALLGDQRFSNDAAAWASQEFKDAGLVYAQGTPVERILTVLDPPDHTRVRRLAMSAFTPRRTAQWEEPTSRIVASALDRLEKRDQPDVMEFASTVPAEVMGEIMGIPLDRFKDMLHAIERAFNTDPGGQDDVTRAFEEIGAYGRELVAEKRRRPGTDLTSSLIQARDGDDRLNEEELVAMVALMIMVGLDTTRNLIGSAALALLDNPDQRELLRTRPELASSAVEEFLRYEGALTIGLFRFAREEVEIGGVRLPAGAPVVAALQSANRDPRRFENPDHLDITRDGPRHLGLGHGLHNCLGAALARLESAIAVPALFERFPRLRLAVPRSELRYNETWLLRSLTSLPVDLHGDGLRGDGRD
ncbi:cytochrome P450 family protein [Streptomyces odonnellii]|uniref:cytochrome P450 family protein n=1 Tax=Streptomyces odonnellii TaxID=1417980 RepID=UPI000626AFC7|nr:cytochrome P450 [Streptomyces odonnellii]